MIVTEQSAKQSLYAETIRKAYPFITDEQKIMRLASAIERAENYPMFGDGLSTPVAVSNVTKYTDPNSGNERIVYNLAAKTAKSFGGPREDERKFPMPNASLSTPVSWGQKWERRDYVCMVVENGEVKKLLPATAMQAQQISYNSRAVARVETVMHGIVETTVDPESGEVLVDSIDQGKALVDKAAKGTQKPSAATILVEADKDDLPF